MNIAVCGYYGMGNFGDELFLHTFRQEFAGHRVFPWSPSLNPAKVDAVIIGGGDLITPYVYNTYYFPEALRHHPTWVYGVGIVDFYPPETWPEAQVALYRERIRHARRLVLRDPASAAHASAMKLHAHVECAPDVVFGFREPRYPVSRSSDGRNIGICVFAYSTFPREKMLELFLGLLKEGYRLQLLPAVNHSNNAYSDYTLCTELREELLRRMPGAQVLHPPLEYDLDLAYSRMQNVDFLLSFKLHPTLAALRGGVPVLCFSRMSKVLHLLRLFGLEENYCNYEAPLEELQQQLRRFLAEGRRPVERARERIRAVEAASRHSLRELRHDIERALPKHSRGD